MRRLLYRSQMALHFPMLLMAFLFLAPLLWMLSTAFKSPEDIINGLGALRWVPRPITTENFTYVLGKAEEFPVWRWTGNSLFISFAVTALVLVVDSLAAFAYSRLRWRGRDALFSLLVATMLVPGQVLLIPAYLLIRALGWFDTYWALIVPAGAGGCGPWLVLRHVILPLSRAPLATLGIFTFMGTWNAFEGPLIFTDSLEMRN